VLSPLRVVGVIVCCTLRNGGVQTSVMQCLRGGKREDEVGHGVAAFVKLVVTPVRNAPGFGRRQETLNLIQGDVPFFDFTSRHLTIKTSQTEVHKSLTGLQR
jgi:hypothetical protein